MSNDNKFLKYKARILAINGGNTQDRLTSPITVPEFRGYTAGEVIPVGEKLIDIIMKEFNSTPVTYTITIRAGSGGTVTPATSQTVNRGSNLTVSATPNSGNQIKSFKVDGATQVSPYTFTNIQTNHVVDIEFEPIPVVTHTIVASAGSNGSISPSGNVTVNDGANQTFTFSPSVGFVINDVLVDGTSIGVQTSYTFSNVTADHTISVSFAAAPPTAHTITASAGAGGSINPVGNVSVNDGANQSFTITPNTGYTIADVLVDGVSQGAQTTYTFTNVTSDHSIVASFNLIPIATHSITVNAGANGSISPAGPVVTVNDGGNQTFTITPNTGYEIEDVKIDNVSQGAITSYSFTNVTSDRSISATFKLIPAVTHTITVTAGANGTISPAGPTVTVNDGASQQFTITPNSGYVIEDIKVDGTSVGTTSPYTFNNVTTDHTIEATFKPVPTYTVNITDNTTGITGYGTIDPTAGAHQVNVGTDTVVTATPASGFKIKTLTVGGTDVTSPYTITGATADQIINVVVEFEVIPSGNIYDQAYTPGAGSRGTTWQEPTATNIVLGTPSATPDTIATAIKSSAGYEWVPKQQSKSITTLLIAKTLCRVTSMNDGLSEALGDYMSEKTITIDGVDYWCYYNNNGVGSGGEAAKLTIKGN